MGENSKEKLPRNKDNDNTDINEDQLPVLIPEAQPTTLNIPAPLENVSSNIPEETTTNKQQPLSIKSPKSSLTLCVSKNILLPKTKSNSLIRPLPSTSYSATTSRFLNTPCTMEMPTLFQLCVSQLNKSSISLSAYTNPRVTQASENAEAISADLSTPDSLTSAPPSYSFVLRQMDLRRRPRLLGTFIPSPSFIAKPPPPTYATAFDIYVDNPIPPPPRMYNYGFTSMPVICPECGYTGMSMITARVTVCTHLCAVALCVFCCWFCVPLPYVLRSCKNVYHYCRNCRTFLGMYCPTNPENVY
ncbi:PREDICTED: uncharacterized protein LOC106105955 [Papilio polytes]|uniref:uncharacterized protein LOC106105955 n=1 Tax=Papilio polytes TaxID=76194 RepID=UPI000675CB69|nr:PREDICTED: uncharacterized protein LOC106105955 [Papilio polytes]